MKNNQSQPGVQEVTEIASRFLGELMLSAPQGPTFITTEALACSVALYLEMLSQANRKPLKILRKEFYETVDQFSELNEGEK